MATEQQNDTDLLQAPRSALGDTLRVAGIAGEFARGFWRMRQLGRCITFFGSARFEPGNAYYDLAHRTAFSAGERGFSIMTGGGPGIMEAANRGAREAGVMSVGCSIQLPKEQASNAYIDLETRFSHFFIRKVMLVRYSQAFIILPGGFGTMDEIFETATLIQTGKINKFPVVLMGAGYWTGLIDFVRRRMVECGTIDERDLQGVYICDDPDEALGWIVDELADSRHG